MLLYLIKKDEIGIYDIPIAHITEQYLAYLELMQKLDISVAGDFLVMASTLIYIKSKTLLPPDPRAEGEGEMGEDPRAGQGAKGRNGAEVDVCRAVGEVVPAPPRRQHAP